jgi:antitoxin component YwqK of YwqJK toxin-antitoxin module
MMMMQYNKQVDKQRNIIRAEKWGKSAKEMSCLIKNGVKTWETYYNNGSIAVEELFSDGKSVKSLTPATLTITELIDLMERESADVK